MSEPASQDLAHSPLTRAKHQFLNARDAFDKSVRLQEYVFDEAKGIPEFLSDSFGISRILLLFPRGTPFLDELIRSNRVQVYSQLAKTTEKPESSQRTIFGIGFNRSGRKTPEHMSQKELEISVRVHYYNDANIVTLVEHSSNLVVDCGVIPPEMPADKFWPYFFRRSVDVTPKLKYASVIIDNSTFINCIDLCNVYGDGVKKIPEMVPQVVSADSDSEDELDEKISCSQV